MVSIWLNNLEGFNIWFIYFKVGDQVFLLFSNQTKGYLSLPTSLGSSACNDFNAVGNVCINYM